MVPTAVRFEIAGVMLGFFPGGALFFRLFGEAGSGGFDRLAPASFLEGVHTAETPVGAVHVFARGARGDRVGCIWVRRVQK